MKNISKLLFIPPVLLGLGALIFAAQLRTGAERRPETEVSRKLRVIPVTRMPFVPRAIGHGESRPARVWEAVAEVKGRIIELNPELKPGAFVSAGSTLSRSTRLVTQNAISKAEVDSSRRSVISQRQMVQSVKTKLNLIPVQIASAKANIKSANANLDEKRRDLERCKIVAPFDCRIGPVDLEESQYLAAIGLLGVFVLLSFQFRSYFEPLVVMAAIPLALIEVLWGHVIVGIDMTMPSALGFASLAGIVVNDSILLVLFLKERRLQNQDVIAAATSASRERFRAIVLTSLTTVAGLLPLIFETSLQAQVLIPMASRKLR